MRYPAVGEIWIWKGTEYECFYSGDHGFGFSNKLGSIFREQYRWEIEDANLEWTGPKTVSDVLCFYVTPANTIKATFYGDKNATGKPYYLKLMNDGELRVHEA